MVERNYKFKSYIKYILITMPLIIGFIGYMPLYDNNMLWSAYSSFRLYQLNTDLNKINLLVEISRWTAPIATITLIVTLFDGIRVFFVLLYRIIMRKNKTCTVYGESAYVTNLTEMLKENAVRSNHKLSLKASNQIIAFDSDNENIEFYNNNFQNIIKKPRIYMHLNNVVRDNLIIEDITVFNIPENCARVYWRDNPIMQACKIAIIGFDEYGQNLLTHGFIQNTFSTNTGVEYHIFGDFNNYKALHYNLDKIATVDKLNPKGDAIFYHNNNWYDEIHLLKSMDRVILCDKFTENIKILSEIVSLCPVKEVHIKTDSIELLNTLFGDEKESSKESYFPKIIAFGIPKDICSPNIVISEELIKKGKKIHAMYYSNNVCSSKNCNRCKCKRDGKEQDKSAESCIACEDFIISWNSLNAFMRYSNIFQADHVEMKLRLLELDKGYSEIVLQKRLHKNTPEQIYELAEIEHIRWCKYYYIHNWEYSKIRSDKDRRHNCLIPFSELSDSEKKKDYLAYTSIYEINN